MICPICGGSLDAIDNQLICQDVCGAVFILEYFGMCNPGDEEVTEEGNESKEWIKEYGDSLNKFKYGEESDKPSKTKGEVK